MLHANRFVIYVAGRISLMNYTVIDRRVYVYYSQLKIVCDRISMHCFHKLKHIYYK